MGHAFTSLRMLWDQSLPPKPTWSADDIPDLTGKVVIVTGGYTGIGLETVRAVLKKNAKVYIAGRNLSKAETAIKTLKDEMGKEVFFIELDLADLKSVKKAAEEFIRRAPLLIYALPVIHTTDNMHQQRDTTPCAIAHSQCSGLMFPPVDMVTVDGYDLQFGTNVLGHFYFTKLLLPVLLETAKSTPERNVRVVTTSSSMHMFHRHGILYDTLRDTPERKKLGTRALYSQSKFGNVLFARELARRYADQGVVSTSLNPGNIKSELQRHVPGIRRKILEAFLYPTPLGAVTQLYAGTAPAAVDLNGAFLVPWARVAEPNKYAKDPKVAEELWTWLEEQVKDI